MEYIYLKMFLAAYVLQNTEGAGCNAYTGGQIRDYDFDYTSQTLTNAQKRLANAEHNQNQRQVEFVLSENADYTTTCECGTVTMWQFFAWKPGTTIFYVLSGTEIVGKTSVYIGDQSIQNFFEVPLSMDMWIPVQSGYSLGFYTDDLSMITYRGRTGNPMYFNRNNAEKNVGDNVESSGTSKTNRRFAVAAYIMEAHPPMFVNTPFETTLYTHETGTVVYTASILDLDGGNVVTVTDITNEAGFLFDPGLLTLTYQSVRAQNVTTIQLRATDGCSKAAHTVTGTIVINLVNEGPSFTNLPASTTVVDSETAQSTIYTLTATDPSGDTVTCSLDSMNPSGPFSISQVSSGVYNIIQSLNPGYTYTSKKYYDLRISCTDVANTIYSNFQVDVVKNEAPNYNAGSGYLPASIYVERTSGATIYQLDYTDPESDSVSSFSVTCSGSCPFSVSASGAVTTTSVLNDEGFDLNINMRDSFGNLAGPYALSVVTSGRPYTHNADPIFVNLDTTIHVMEHTTVGTFLLKVLYTDENPTDTFTLAKASTNTADTYFNFDATTGIISVKADVDFEAHGSGGWEMLITVNDGAETQHVTVTGTVTFNIVNINEGITLTIANPAISADETLNRGDAFSPSPGISSTDIDAGDTAYYTMDCGADTKYFYLDTSTLDVKFAREYDMDSGLSGTATCNVTVRDDKGLSDSGLITLTINNINDHSPKFPQNIYVFFVFTTTTFFTEVTNMAATDVDSDAFGSTAGTITYNFNPVNPTEDYFQLDVSGVLFVRNLTTYTANTYVFEVIASDSGSLTGTCTVTVIFSAATVTTTTSTERPLIFKDDYQNYIWLLLCSIGIFATMIVIVLMVWKDPIVNENVNFKIYKLCLWCRKKPKPKEPRRTVGKLRVTVNKKELENDPDNALPWELLAKDNEVPEVNEVQEMIEHRLEKKDREYKNFSGLPVFERGKGGRPDSGRATVHSSASSNDRPESNSPKYATFIPSDDIKESNSPKYATFIPSEDIKDKDGGEGQWGDLTERRVIITPVVRVKEAEAGNNDATRKVEVGNYEETNGAEGSNFAKTAEDIPDW